MPLLHEIRNLFRRKRVAVIDLSGTQASGLEDRLRSNADSMDNGAERDSDSSLAVQRRPLRKRSLDELQQSYDEVMTLVRKLSDHLDQHTSRTERLLELLERLPAALDAMPEVNRQNTRLLEMLESHLSQSHSRDEALNASLRKLTACSEDHNDLLGLLQQQLDSNGQATTRVMESVADLRPSLSDMAESARRSSESVAQLSRAAEDREARMSQAMARAQTWMIAGIFICCAVSAIGVIVAVMAMMR